MNQNNYSLWERKKDLNLDNFDTLVSLLVGNASLAGNSHNSQPWSFVVGKKEKSISLFMDPKRVLTVSDVSGRQSVISCGCALENLLVSINEFGLDFSIDFIDEKNGIAKVKIKNIEQVKSPKKHSEIYNSIFTRRVNRSKCRTDKSVPSDFLNQIADLNYGLEIKTITDNLTKNAIAEIQEQADRFVLGNDKFRKELGEWLLPNNTKSYLGMPGSTFGLKDSESELIHHQLLTGKLDYDLASGVAISDRQRIQTSPLVLVIVGDDNKENWINTGRLWQRISLIAESVGLSVAVSAAIVEVPLLSGMLSMRLATIKKPLMITTIGYALEERPHSPRLPVSEIFTFSD